MPAKMATEISATNDNGLTLGIETIIFWSHGQRQSGKAAKDVEASAMTISVAAFSVAVCIKRRRCERAFRRVQI